MRSDGSNSSDSGMLQGVYEDLKMQVTEESDNIK